VEKEVQWPFWLGDTKPEPFNERHFWHWRCYWRYGTGQAGDLLSHELDFVQYLLGHGIPDTCYCTGINALLKDDREVPDTWNAIYEFENIGRTVTFSASMNATSKQPVEICGKEATLQFDGIAHDVTDFTVTAAPFNTRADLPKRYARGKTPQQPNHLQDFFNCMRTRGTPKSNVDEAFIESATSLMSIESYKQRRQVRWDSLREEMV
jgi:predicted dehydrogenase